MARISGYYSNSLPSPSARVPKLQASPAPPRPRSTPVRFHVLRPPPPLTRQSPSVSSQPALSYALLVHLSFPLSSFSSLVALPLRPLAFPAFPGKASSCCRLPQCSAVSFQILYQLLKARSPWQVKVIALKCRGKLYLRILREAKRHSREWEADTAARHAGECSKANPKQMGLARGGGGENGCRESSMPTEKSVGSERWRAPVGSGDGASSATRPQATKFTRRCGGRGACARSPGQPAPPPHGRASIMAWSLPYTVTTHFALRTCTHYTPFEANRAQGWAFHVADRYRKRSAAAPSLPECGTPAAPEQILSWASFRSKCFNRRVRIEGRIEVSMFYHRVSRKLHSQPSRRQLLSKDLTSLISITMLGAIGNVRIPNSFQCRAPRRWLPHRIHERQGTRQSAQQSEREALWARRGTAAAAAAVCFLARTETNGTVTDDLCETDVSETGISIKPNEYFLNDEEDGRNGESFPELFRRDKIVWDGCERHRPPWEKIRRHCGDLCTSKEAEAKPLSACGAPLVRGGRRSRAGSPLEPRTGPKPVTWQAGGKNLHRFRFNAHGPFHFCAVNDLTLKLRFEPNIANNIMQSCFVLQITRPKYRSRDVELTEENRGCGQMFQIIVRLGRELKNRKQVVHENLDWLKVSIKKENELKFTKIILASWPHYATTDSEPLAKAAAVRFGFPVGTGHSFARSLARSLARQPAIR
ncbi:Protein of unknown function [Gryllus bimaculatus]|nr:Protein of unknown function [Gryllus bimaculatus]